MRHKLDARAVGDPLHIDPRAAKALGDGSVGDPFALLGPHRCSDGLIVRTFQPGAQAVTAVDAESGAALAPLREIQIDGLFAGLLPATRRYRLRIHWPQA